MATLVHTTEPIDQSTWDIQRDSFAPPTTRRIVRGWDRAPVSARAPRLHGQKVWKKVALKVGSIEEIQNEAQDELEKEGAGARKKSRMLTARENINDAMWIKAVPIGNALDVGSMPLSDGVQLETLNNPAANTINIANADFEVITSHMEGIKAQAEQHQSTSCLQFIPRKRTNTDHVITPKKALQQTTLQHKKQTLSGPEFVIKADRKTFRPRKSLRKSMIENISDSAPKRRISRAQSRLSSSAEQLSIQEHLVSISKVPVNGLEDTTSKKRTLRRSTISKSTASCIEESDNIGQHSLQSAMSNQRDTTASGATASAQLNPPGEVIQCPKLDENSINESSKLYNPTELDGSGPLQPTNESIPNSLHVCVPATNTKVRDDVDNQPQESPSDIGSDSKQVLELCPDNDASQSDTSEDRNSSAANIISHTSAVATEFEACQTTSSSEAAAVTGYDGSSAGLLIVLSVHAAGTGSLETEDKISKIESNMSPQPVSEIDIHSDIQKTETPDPPKPSSTATVYDHDDTDMLRNFLTRVKANKAANNPPKRKRSLPHSPLRIPLGDMDNNASPSPLQLQKGGEFDVAAPSPSKRKKKSSPLSQFENEPEPRRSGRTKPPAKEPPGAPSFIPVRRLGQDIDTTVTLKRNEEKELAALTRVNTRKNKGNALTALEVLAKKSEEKEDPAMRQRLLKEVFDEKMEKGRQDKEKKGREKKSVTWAEELTRFQLLVKAKGGEAADEKEKEKCVVVQSGGEEKKPGAVKVGVRSKAALGMALNGTPAPKRKMRGRV